MIEDDFLAAPRCPQCLLSMQIAGPDDAPYWKCTQCGLVQVA